MEASPCGEGWGKEGDGDGGGGRRATTPTNRGMVLVCAVPRNQSLVPRGGPYSPKKLPPTSASAPLREHLKDTQAQLKARIVELERVRKKSAMAQKAAEDKLREERVKWEEERREKDSEIRDSRVKLQDASVRASKKGPASPGPGEGGKDVEDQRSFLQLAAMEIRDGLVQATTSIEVLRDSLQDARGKETTQGQKTLTALTALRNKYTVQSLQLGKPAEQPGGGNDGGS